ncbi:hypothetical protein CP981_21235 [Streptomyces platensis]|nr:hypothetical protein [Streptomyces platensis]QEV56964.1 hypothetical protein CP981_21235 [Streptomyces platensis]
MRAEEIPPGVQEVILPSGERALAYSTGPTSPPSAPAAPVVPVAQPIPAWAKTTALLAPTVGGGIGMAAVGLSTAAPGLIAMSHALWSAVALIATGGTAAAILIGRVRARINGAQRPHITQHITATGFLGRANGTINHH